jgi:hypothetical protein
MLIVSDYKDYYDTVQNMGVDKSCVYNRDTVTYDVTSQWGSNELKAKELSIKLPFTLPMYQTFGDIEYHFFLVGFCGSVYYGYTWVDPETKEKHLSYDVQGLYDKFHSKKKKYYYWGWREFNIETIKKAEEQKIDDFFIKLKEETGKPIPIFVLENTESLRSRKIELTLNPILKNYNFVTRKDVYTAYQDIYSYISGVLGISEKPIVEISEKNKIESKGFDKWSFRNPDPPKRKQ